MTLLRRQNAVVLLGLAGVTAFAWSYLMLFFPRDNDHAARADRVRLALESTEDRVDT